MMFKKRQLSFFSIFSKSLQGRKEREQMKKNKEKFSLREFQKEFAKIYNQAIAELQKQFDVNLNQKKGDISDDKKNNH